MSIFSPLYNQIIVEKKKKKDYSSSFENKDLDSLECLRMTNESIGKLINNFDSFKWKNNKYTNLLMLDFCTKNSNVKFLNNTMCCDSLYVNKNNNNDDKEYFIKVIYVTSHIIYYHYLDGYSIADILNKKIINVENLCVIPKFVFRSFENKSVELIDDNDVKKFKSNRYVTLKAFYDYYHNKKYDLENIQAFLNNVFDIFVHNNLLPYFIHPQRLFLYEDDSIKLVSPSLLQFILAPYFRYAKIQHSLFSHPIVLENNEHKGGKAYAQRIITDSVDLFLDFFHSLFVTVLWIHNLNNDKAFDYIVRNEHSFFNNMTSIFMKNNKSTKISKTKESIFFNLQQNNNNNDSNNVNNSISPCKHIHGFCLNYYDEPLRNLIHNYGCHHLQINMPLILNTAMNQANDNNQLEIFLSSVKLQFEIFSNFLNQLKNI